ncbi:MAG: marine proteobacterial sortase target protein [Rhodospirillales bacterium]|nr:marine proteobacterial sortase target protein [Rhodospirillales bacterium]
MLAASAAGPRPGRTAAFQASTLASQALNALLAFLLLVACLGWSIAGWAAPGLGSPGGSQTFRKPGDAQRGELLYRDKGGVLWQAVPLLSTEVEIGVGGAAARVALVQRFKNASSAWLEGVYVFPLPETAAVDSLRIRIGERVIEGRIAERQQAKKEYEQARAAGQRAGLVEQERPNIFTTSVANIGPGEEIEVRLGYAQTVERAGLTFRLRFPMVVGPRYTGQDQALLGASTGPTTTTTRVPDAHRITPPVMNPAHGPINPVEIAVRLDPGFPISRVNSPFHAIDSKALTNRVWTIALADGAIPADRDFELEWTPAASTEPLARVFAETQPEARYALLTVMPPSAAAPAEPTLPREAIFIIDTSGSMEGESIVQARQALSLALSRLKPADRFNVIEFNSRARRLFARAEVATPAQVRYAQGWVEALKANGGTEMRQALDLALDGNSDPTRLRQIVFLTDGAVGNEADLFAQVTERLGDTRLFTVGIGSAPNGYFMRKAAEVGRGSAVFIGKPEQVAERMGELFRRLERPAMTDLAVAWPGVATDSLPNPLPDLYDGEPVVLAARLPAGTAGPVVLTGRIGGKPWRADLTLAANDDPPAGVPSLWARRKVEALEDTAYAGAKGEQIRDQVIQVALSHSLVTRYTSLVAVDATPARPEDARLGGGAMPTNLPKGWSYDALFGEAAPPQPQPTRGGVQPIRHVAAPAPSLLSQTVADRFQAQQAAASQAAAGATPTSQPIALPQTATPAALLMLTGAMLLGLAGFIAYTVRRKEV